MRRSSRSPSCSTTWASTSSRPASRSPRKAISPPCTRSPQRAKNAVICGLSRAAFKDIDRCAEAIKPAKRKRIHTFISTSPVHMKYKLQKEPHEVYEMVIAQVTRARSHTDDVEWSAEDGTRTEHDFLCRCVEAAINAGATTINIPDTVGYTVPEEYFALIEMLRDARAEFRQGALLGALPQRSRHGGGQFARRRARRARARSNAPSTASASAPATPRSKRS